MSAWRDKYVIGLTGNIATGKSVVRKMLEHLGAYGIDADALANRAIAQDAPGYQVVVDTFGTWILNPDGQINRGKLGRIVFNDPEALRQLESIVHPLVGKAIDLLVRRSHHKVIVLEAIKLLESGLDEACDSIWVTVASPQVRLSRLVHKRGMDEATALERIRSQPPQEEKIAAAQVIIRNEAGFEEIWNQVLAAWQEIIPTLEIEAERPRKPSKGEMLVERARLQHAEEIATFVSRFGKASQEMTRQDVIAAFGERAFLLLNKDDRLIGVIGWQVENLVARTSDVFLKPGTPLREAMSLLMGEMERASRDLQCEVSLLFLPPSLARHEEVWGSLGYDPRTIQSLKVRAWQEAAQESMPKGTVLLFKQLRKDRVLRPV